MSKLFLRNNQDVKTKTRFYYIDFLKFVASFFVIFSHCLMSFVIDFDKTPLFNLIWLTQMPLFMFLAGLCETSENKVSVARLLFKRLAKNFFILVIPCFTYMIFKLLIYKQSIINQFIDFYYRPDTNLWFLWVLFLIHLIFETGLYVHSKINKQWSITVPFILSAIVSILIFISMSLVKVDLSILGLKYLCYYIIFFCLGYLFKLFLHSKFLVKKATQIALLVIFCLSLFVFLFEIFYFKSIYSFSDTNLGLVTIRLCGSISSIVVFMVLGDLICHIHIFQKISFLGRFSLESYYIHVLLIQLLTYSVSNQSLAIQYLTALGSSILLSVAVVLVLLVIFFVPYSHLIIFGRSWSFYKFEKKLPQFLR